MARYRTPGGTASIIEATAKDECVLLRIERGTSGVSVAMTRDQAEALIAEINQSLADLARRREREGGR